jgi:HEAT repeat protein
VRSIAATALGAIDAARYADRIESALHDGVWQVRYNAAKALCDVPDIDAILLRVEASGDRYAYEILRYTIHDFQLREVRA